MKRMTEQRTELTVKKKKNISLRFDAVVLSRIDKWCQAQPEQPTRSAAVRWLVYQALEGGK